jgi:tetraacyldisaccharide 4'-kinase
MPFGHLYNLILKARSALYQKGIARSYDLGVPVISVGNITLGGTGKTPLAAFVAGVLADNGRKVCILTRGYKRANSGKRVLVSDGTKILAGAKESGDEPFELALKLLGVSAVIADKDRAAAGIWARENLGSDAFILDDGFQHLKLGRDLDLVTIDATNPFGNGWLLPQGTLREPVESLQRAGAIILTRANLAENIDSLKAQVKKIAPHPPLFVSHNKTTRLVSLSGLFTGELEASLPVPAPEKALAFCALGNPPAFFGQLRAEGFGLAGTEAFPDHHAYSQKDILGLEDLARTCQAEILLTTAKDAVKLKELQFSIPCYVVESELVFDDEPALRELILKTLKSKF